MQDDNTNAAAVAGPAVERGVRPLAGPNVRRMLRAARLCEELGHAGDTLAALEELQRLRAVAAEYDAWMRFHDAGSGDFYDFQRLRKAA